VIAGASLQIQEKAGRFAAWSTARVLVSIAVRVVFVIVLVGGAAGFIAANLVTAAVFALAALWLLRTEVAPGFLPAVIREAFRLGGPTVPNNLLSYGFRLLDRIVLERFVSLEQVGLYYLALRLSDVIRLTGDILINAWRPVFFKEADDPTFRTEDVPRIIRIATVVLAVAFVGVSVFAREVVAVFAAPAYRQAYVFVPLLTAAMLLKGFQSFPYLTIWLRKRTNWVPMLSVLTLFTSLLANVILAPRWGAMGVAAALVVAYLVLTIMILMVARGLYAIPYPWRTLLLVGSLSIGAVGIAVPLPAGSVSTLAKLAIVAGYVVALVATGCVDVAELRALWPKDRVPQLRRKTVTS